MSKIYEEYLDMVRYDGKFLYCVPEKMQTDEIIDAAMDDDVWAFMHIGDESKKTYKRCVKAVRGYIELLDEVPEELKDRVKKELGV